MSTDDEADARVKMTGQIGGLKQIDAGKIKGLQKPKDDPPEQSAPPPAPSSAPAP